MPGAVGDRGRRVIGEPVVPGVEPGVAASHGILLVAPVVEIVRRLVKRGRFPAGPFSVKSSGSGFLRDERFVRNIRHVLRLGKLRQCEPGDGEKRGGNGGDEKGSVHAPERKGRSDRGKAWI